MGLQDWAGLATIVAGFVAVFTLMSRRFDSMSGRLDGMSGRLDSMEEKLERNRMEARTELAAFRADIKQDLGRIDSRLEKLEQRTYDLATKRPSA